MKINCIVLAGGQGRRLGSDKALETIGGESLIKRVVTTLMYFQGIIIVVTGITHDNLGLDEIPQVKLVADTYPAKGPLAGIRSGLSASDTFHNIVVACDMPFLNVNLLEYMARQAEGYNAVVASLKGNLEPLHAIYGRSCLEVIDSMFTENDFQTNHLFRKINTRHIEVSEIDRFDPHHLSFFNINTKSDMIKARKLSAN